jgi:hypothetical protein
MPRVLPIKSAVLTVHKTENKSLDSRFSLVGIYVVQKKENMKFHPCGNVKADHCGSAV